MFGLLNTYAADIAHLFIVSYGRDGLLGRRQDCSGLENEWLLAFAWVGEPIMMSLYPYFI